MDAKLRWSLLIDRKKLYTKKEDQAALERHMEFCLLTHTPAPIIGHLAKKEQTVLRLMVPSREFVV